MTAGETGLGCSGVLNTPGVEGPEESLSVTLEGTTVHYTDEMIFRRLGKASDGCSNST